MAEFDAAIREKIPAVIALLKNAEAGTAGATAALKDLHEEPLFPLVLLRILIAPDAPMGVRRLAIIETKNVISESWLGNHDEYSLPDPVKAEIRAALISRVIMSSPDQTVARQLADAVSNIARFDMTMGRWPELLPTLAEYLQEGKPPLALNALESFKQVAVFIDVEGIDQTFLSFEPVLFRILSADGGDPANVPVNWRVAALEAFSHLVQAVETQCSGAAVVKLLRPRFSDWLRVITSQFAFADPPNKDFGVDTHSELTFQRTVCTFISSLIASMPSSLVPFMAQILTPFTEGLERNIERYTALFVRGPADPMTTPEYTHIRGYLHEALELLYNLAETEHEELRRVLAEKYEYICYFLITAMMYTKAFAERANERAMSYAAHALFEESANDDEADLVDLRAAAKRDLDLILMSNGIPAIQGGYRALMRHAAQATKLREAGNPDWWVENEAVLYGFQSMMQAYASIAQRVLVGGPDAARTAGAEAGSLDVAGFDPKQVVQNVLLPEARNAASNPFVRAKALEVLPEFVYLFVLEPPPPALIATCNEMVRALVDAMTDPHHAVWTSAMLGLENLCLRISEANSGGDAAKFNRFVVVQDVAKEIVDRSIKVLEMASDMQGDDRILAVQAFDTMGAVLELSAQLRGECAPRVFEATSAATVKLVDIPHIKSGFIHIIDLLATIPLRPLVDLVNALAPFFITRIAAAKGLDSEAPARMFVPVLLGCMAQIIRNLDLSLRELHKKTAEAGGPAPPTVVLDAVAALCADAPQALELFRKSTFELLDMTLQIGLASDADDDVQQAATTVSRFVETFGKTLFWDAESGRVTPLPQTPLFPFLDKLLSPDTPEELSLNASKLVLRVAAAFYDELDPAAWASFARMIVVRWLTAESHELALDLHFCIASLLRMTKPDGANPTLPHPGMMFLAALESLPPVNIPDTDINGPLYELAMTKLVAEHVLVERHLVLKTSLDAMGILFGQARASGFRVPGYTRIVSGQTDSQPISLPAKVLLLLAKTFEGTGRAFDQGPDFWGDGDDDEEGEDLPIGGAASHGMSLDIDGQSVFVDADAIEMLAMQAQHGTTDMDDEDEEEYHDSDLLAVDVKDLSVAIVKRIFASFRPQFEAVVKELKPEDVQLVKAMVEA